MRLALSLVDSADDAVDADVDADDVVGSCCCCVAAVLVVKPLVRSDPFWRIPRIIPAQRKAGEL